MSPATNRNGITSPFDIAIIGAGPAGIAAAAVAAPSARVILVEASNQLGGSVTAAMHRCLCGLYSSLPKNPLDTLNGSVQRDVVRRMIDRDRDHVIPRQLGLAPVLEFPRAAYETALAEIAAESKADLRLNCRLTNVRVEDRRVAAIEISDPDPKWISINALVDCTGAGHVLKLLGPAAYQPPQPPDRPMLGGYAVHLAHLNADLELLRLQIPFALAKAVQAGKLPHTARFTVFYPGPGPAEGICKLAMNPAEMSSDEAKILARRVIAFLIAEFPSLTGATIAEESPRLLPRDGLRLLGRATLTESDVLNPHTPDPSTVRAWWPIEKWDLATGPSYAYPPPSTPYAIPDGALQSAAFENLLAAGTALSATASGAASARASGICLATGAAAGRLALAHVNH